MKLSIYPSRSQAAASVLSDNVPAKVLVVPVDFAKREHVAQVCRGTGEFVLKHPLTVKNTPEGAEYLRECVARICRQLNIPRGNVLIGGEDPPPFTMNFVHALAAEGHRVVRVNAAEAKKYRTNTRATSDTLVLNGIAQAILCRRAYDVERADELYTVMRQAARSRHRLVCEETAVKNRIHRHVEVLFPGFLSEKRSGLTAFGSPALDLMSRDFSVTRIRRMRTATLVKRLKARQVHHAGQTAAKLKSLANDVLAPPPELVPYQARSLAAKVELLRSIRAAIRSEENEMARALVQTPGFFATTIPGIGLILAAGIIGEYGNGERWPTADQMASYAGIVRRQFQTGGPDSEPVNLPLPLKANHRLKDWLLQAAFHVGTTPHPAWKKLPLQGDQHALFVHYRTVELREGCSRLSTAKKLLRILRAMVRQQCVYLPHNALDPNATDALPAREFVTYHRIVLDTLERKWKRYDLSGIPDQNNRLVQLQEQIHALTELTERNGK